MQDNKNLNIYLVSLKEGDIRYYSDDFYTTFMVCCKSHEDARKIHPSGRYEYTEKEWKNIVTEKEHQSTIYCPKNSEWVEPNEVKDLNVECVGKASKHLLSGKILLASYNG